MEPRNILALTLLLALTACGGGSDATASGAEGASADGAPASADAVDIDCPPLQVTIDGEPVEGLDHAFGFSEAKTGPGTGGFGVQVFNHPENGCAEVLATSRNVPEGEVEVRAFVQAGASRGSVSVGSKTNFAQGVELVNEPNAQGDLVAICVSGAKWTAGGFGGDGPTYEISGLFAGTYCGER